MTPEMRPGYSVGQEWTARGLTTDARAITRGDIMVDEPDGRVVYPRYFERAAGAYMWDVDGNRFIDYQLGYGPVVLGHADPRVTAAVTAQLERGTCIAPLWSPLQVQLTELLIETIPGAELAYLLKTGSDATSAAVRLARIFTGRDMVVRWGYNGWHDWAAGNPAGVPEPVRELSLTFDHRPETLKALFDRYPGQIACVLTMPFEFTKVPDLRLEQLREITHANGALFVLDEMRSGFRMGLGGAQEYFRVQADLTAFSKAIANGYPISALVGRGDVMRCLGQTRISSTFYAGPAEMAAALTTIRLLRDTDALARIWKMGTLLQEGLAALVKEFESPAEVVGYPVVPFLRFDADSDLGRRLRRQFFMETTRGGVLLHPEHQWFVSAAHTVADIEMTLDVCRRAFESLDRVS